MYQIRTEQIEFVIQRDKLTHQVVLHLAVHLFIVPTVAVIRLAVYNIDARLQVPYGTRASALGFCQLLFASAFGQHRAQRRLAAAIASAPCTRRPKSNTIQILEIEPSIPSPSARLGTLPPR